MSQNMNNSKSEKYFKPAFSTSAGKILKITCEKKNSSKIIRFNF